MSRHKGQANYADFLVAITVFVIVLAFLLQYFAESEAYGNDAVRKAGMEASAIAITDLMLKGPGMPSNWENNRSSAQTIGLAVSQNKLSGAKLANFTNMSYANASSLIGTDYQFYFYVENLSSDRLYETGNSTIGGNAVSITRFAALNGKMVRVRLVLHG